MDPGWPTVRKIPLTLKRRERGAEVLAAAWRHAAQADHEADARAVCTQRANTYRRRVVPSAVAVGLGAFVWVCTGWFLG